VGSKRIELSASVRDAEVLPTQTQEDLILLSLSSGWLLIVKVYSDGTVPLVVKRIRIGDRQRNIASLGHDVQCDWLGRVFAVTALQDQFKVYSVMKNPDALSICPISVKEEYVIPLAGCTILNSCFLHPLKDASENHVLYLVLYTTPDCRLKMTMYEWWNDRSLLSFQIYGTLPLDLPPSSAPLFMVPISCEDSGVVLVTPTKAFVVTCHDILSGNIRFSVSKEITKFPLTYYKEPLTRVSIDVNRPPDDIFFISGEMGTIYMVHASTRELVIEPLVEVKLDLGSTFVLQPYDRDTGVIECPVVDSPTLLVTYGGDLSQGGSFITDISLEEDDENDETEYLEANELFDNWAPLNDFQVIANRSSCFSGIDLYACTGQNKTGALCHLSYGIKATMFQEGTKMEGVNRMFSIVDDTDSLTYMVISFPWSTNVFDITVNDFGYPELEDVSDDCGLRVSDSETLTVGFVPGTMNVLQVTNNEIIMSDMNGVAKMMSIDHTTLVSFCGHFLAIGSLQGNTTDGAVGKWKITLYKVHHELDSESWITQLGYPVVTESDISVLKLLDCAENIKCFLGTRLPSISVYRIDETAGLEYEMELKDIFPPDLTDSIPNDICCYPKQSSSYLIGLRNGVCLLVEQGNVKLKRKLGEIPVEFIPYESQDYVFIKNGQLSALQYPSQEIHKVVFDFTHATEVNTLCPIYADGPSSVISAVVVNKCLQIIRMTMSPQMVSKRLEIGATPKRMVYLDHLSVFAVAIQTTRKRRERGNYQLGFFGSKRLESATVSNGPLLYGQRSTSDQSPDKLVFSLDESVYSLSEWSVVQNGKTYKYILVGTGYDTTQRGKIRILRVYRNKETGSVEVVRQYSQETDGPVYAISSLNGASIVYSTVNCHTQESRIHVNVMEEDNRNVFRMTKYSSGPLKGPVTQLTTSNDNIFASTVKNSVFILRFENGDISVLHGDGVARATVNHVSLDDNHILVSDKSQLFTGLRRTAPGKVTLETFFKTELPSVIVKTRQTDYRLVWGEERIDPRENTFLSASIGGAFYGFRVISSAELKRIRDHIMANASSEADNEISDPDEPEPLYPGPNWADDLVTSNKVIDYDVLRRKFGDSSWLINLLS
jgi:hypothetical protein